MPTGIRHVVGRPNLRPPPGFEHLDGLVLDEEISFGPAPASPPRRLLFPSPVPSPPPPSLEPTSPVSLFRTSSFEELEEEMIHAVIEGHHLDQVVAVLQRKAEEGLVSPETKENQRVLYLDWAAGNPRDPLLAFGLASNGKAAARNGVNEVDCSKQWSKSLFYGDWLSSRFGETQIFVEIQVKRISGSDPELLRECGISPEYVWLPLQDERERASEPTVTPSMSLGGEFSVGPSMTPERAAVSSPFSEVEDDLGAPKAKHPEDSLPPSASDKGKGKEMAAAPRPLPDPASLTRQQVMKPVSSGRPNYKVTLTPAIPALMRAPFPMEIPPADATTPRHQPAILSATSQPEKESNDEAEENSYDQAVTLVAQRIQRIQLVDLKARAIKRESTIKRAYSCTQDPEFKNRIQNSFVYAVRVVAIPVSKQTVNHATGPPSKDRKGTILGIGGWVVPPMEERLRYRDAHPGIYDSKVAPTGQYECPPKPQIQIAMPITFDKTGDSSARYYGELAPVWRELSDPTLEDVLWMAWQLVSGKQFSGFNHDHGFGLKRLGYQGDPELLDRCPFKSPSEISMYHGANYHRGNDKGKTAAAQNTSSSSIATACANPFGAHGNTSTTPTGSPPMLPVSPDTASGFQFSLPSSSSTTISDTSAPITDASTRTPVAHSNTGTGTDTGTSASSSSYSALSSPNWQPAAVSRGMAQRVTLPLRQLFLPEKLA